MTRKQKLQTSDLLEAHQIDVTDVPGRMHLAKCKLQLTTEAVMQANQYLV